MGNEIHVVVRHEFCTWRNMQPDLHLSDAKQMEDFQSFWSCFCRQLLLGGCL